MPKHKLLFVSHNHPEVRPGGAEYYALDLYEAIRDSSEEFDPVLISRTGPPVSEALSYHDGRPVLAVNSDPNQYFFYVSFSGYDHIYGKLPYKPPLTRFFREFLLSQKPDLVHFQHTMFFGYDILRVTRNALPDVPIVCTLHEFLPICHRSGQMVRTKGNELCNEESPRRCNECFPTVTPQTFFMRKRFIQSHLSVVDLFITFSEDALERYVAWGIPRERIRFEPHGLPASQIQEPLPEEPRARRNRFAFFGQFTPFKGADLLLEAAKKLEDFDGHVWMHGANLEMQERSFVERFERLEDETRDSVTVAGHYDRADLPELMADVDWVVVPSIWPETGPLVVPEAFVHGRPVICSDIGGMAEKVTDGVNGLHFRRASAESLARVIRRAAATPGLWEKLRAGIPAVRTMDEHVRGVTASYRSLLSGDRRSAGAEVPPLTVVRSV
jgi:glycosyltransferase involved in cell wall biosynthesis